MIKFYKSKNFLNMFPLVILFISSIYQNSSQYTVVECKDILEYTQFFYFILGAIWASVTIALISVPFILKRNTHYHIAEV